MMKFKWFLVLSFYSSGVCCTIDEPSLSVLVKSHSSAPNDDSFREDFYANLTQDWVVIEFGTPDGMHVTELTDFKNEVRLWRVIILGEEERGDPSSESLCFAAKLVDNDLLTPSSVFRLRQRNPTSLKAAEVEKNMEKYEFGVVMSAEHASYMITMATESLCKNSLAGVMLPNNVYSALTTTPESNGDDDPHIWEVRQLATSSLNPCSVSNLMPKRPCRCKVDFCIPWYPCGWKLCSSKTNKETNVDSISSTYKCGIKSCRKCYSMMFEVSEKRFCMWDE